MSDLSKDKGGSGLLCESSGCWCELIALRKVKKLEPTLSPIKVELRTHASESEPQPQLPQNIYLSIFAYYKSGTECVTVQQPSEFHIVNVQLYDAAMINMLWSFLKCIFVCYIAENV